MPTKVIMPQLGESVVEGKVSRWLKQVGDSVAEYEPLLEVSTDKVDTEVPSPADGTLLQIYVPEGDTVARGVLLAMIGTLGDTIPALSDSPSPQTERGSGGEVNKGQGGEANQRLASQANQRTEVNRISPVVARMAAEHQLDLSHISGTGLGGRVTKKDVEGYLEQRQTATAESEVPPWEQPVSGDLFKPTEEVFAKAQQALTPSPSPVGRGESRTLIAPAPISPSPQAERGQGGEANQRLAGEANKTELVPLSTMRRAIADHMVRSKLQTSPHVTTVFEVDLSAVIAHQTANMAAFSSQGLRLTFTAYFVLAAVKGLQAQPWINSQWTDKGVLLHKAAHIGMAVAIPDGLIVPVIRDAQDLNLMGAARHVNDLADRARAKALRPDDVTGGTFTITNHGVSGSLLATPIINQPQAAILGIGALQKRVVVLTDERGDTLAIRPMLYATLTFDHRLIDGAMADGFMSVFKRALESWS